MDNLSAEGIVTCLYDLDAFRRGKRFEAACTLAQTFNRCEGNPNKIDPWLTYIKVAAEVTLEDVDTELIGPAIGRAMRQERIVRIAALQ